MVFFDFPELLPVPVHDQVIRAMFMRFVSPLKSDNRRMFLELDTAAGVEQHGGCGLFRGIAMSEALAPAETRHSIPAARSRTRENSPRSPMGRAGPVDDDVPTHCNSLFGRAADRAIGKFGGRFRLPVKETGV